MLVKVLGTRIYAPVDIFTRMCINVRRVDNLYKSESADAQ
jgi:hypothetical protein